MQFSFSNPEYLVLLFLIPIIVFVHFFAIRLTRKTAIKFSNFDAVARIKGVDIFSKNMVSLFISSIILFFIVISLSGLIVMVKLNSSQFSYVLAIDSSESMLADDISPNRLEYAKESAIDFVEKTPYGTKMGVISFSGNAIVESRVIGEKDEIINYIKLIEPTEIGGTDISEALVTSTNLLLEENYKSIIILSDGQINTGKIDRALEYASRNNVIIHTAGIGTIEGGKTSYGISKLDEDSLKSISYNTEGIYLNMQNGDSLSNFFDQVIKFEKVNVPIDTSKYFLIASLLLFLIHFVLINTRYRMYP